MKTNQYLVVGFLSLNVLVSLLKSAQGCEFHQQPMFGWGANRGHFNGGHLSQGKIPSRAEYGKKLESVKKSRIIPREPEQKAVAERTSPQLNDVSIQQPILNKESVGTKAEQLVGK